MFEYICFMACILSVSCAVICTIYAVKCKKNKEWYSKHLDEAIDVANNAANGWTEEHMINKNINTMNHRIMEQNDRLLVEFTGLKLQFNDLEQKLKEKENA